MRAEACGLEEEGGEKETVRTLFKEGMSKDEGRYVKRERSLNDITKDCNIGAF
jgi:hypothetical protein